jgi:hypothetical protein
MTELMNIEDNEDFLKVVVHACTSGDNSRVEGQLIGNVSHDFDACK